MKYFFILFFPLTVFGQSLSWKETNLYLKTKTSKDKLQASFEYTNKSKKIIKFLSVKASCGCVLVEAPKIVNPGETGTIVFKAPIPHGGGSYTKSILVNTDESKKADYKLLFKVTNTDPYIAKPPKTNNQSEQKTNEKTVQYIPPKGYNRPEKMTTRSLLVEKLMAKQALARKDSFYKQDECPFLPLPINPKLYHDFEGIRIYTCCEQCLLKVKESPYHAIIKLAEKTQTPIELKSLLESSKE